MKDKLQMTDLDIQAADALYACTFLPASYNKRFARDIHGMAHAEKPEATARQLKTLWYLVYRYRGQIKSQQLVEIAIDKQHEYESIAALEDMMQGISRPPNAEERKRLRILDELKREGHIGEDGRLVF